MFVDQISKRHRFNEMEALRGINGCYRMKIRRSLNSFPSKIAHLKAASRAVVDRHPLNKIGVPLKLLAVTNAIPDASVLATGP